MAEDMDPVDGMPDFRRRPSSLARGEEGQITIMFALLSMALVFFWMSVYQSGEVINARVKVQDVSDASAYTGAVWGARMMNVICYTNRAIIANLVSMTEVVIARSNSKFWVDVAVIIFLLASYLDWIPVVGEILYIVGAALMAVTGVYETATYMIAYLTLRTPNLKYMKCACGWWFILLHNLCALENSIHWMLAPPPTKLGFDPGTLAKVLNTATIPIAIKDMAETIDPPPTSGTADEQAAVNRGRTYVNPSLAELGSVADPGPALTVSLMSGLFQTWSLQSYDDLLTWPGGGHGLMTGPRKGPYEYWKSSSSGADAGEDQGSRRYGMKSGYNKLIDQKYRLKWLVTETAKKDLSGLWSWDRGNQGSGWMSQLFNLNCWFFGVGIGGTTRVDLIHEGTCEIVDILGGELFVKIAAPDEYYFDHDIEAWDTINIWYRKFWDFFKFPTQTIVEGGEVAQLTKDADPLFAQLLQDGNGTQWAWYAFYYWRPDIDYQDDNDMFPNGYKGLPHQDNYNHELKPFMSIGGGMLPAIPTVWPPMMFPTIGFDLSKSDKEKTVWLPTGIHEINNDKFMEGNKNRADRAIWQGGGPPGFTGHGWFSKDLPSYCYVLDAKADMTAGGSVSDDDTSDDETAEGHKFYLPMEDKRGQKGQQLGKRVGLVMTVAYKSGKGLNLIQIMGGNETATGYNEAQADSDSTPLTDNTQYYSRKDSVAGKGESLNHHIATSDWEHSEPNLHLIKSSKLNGLLMSGLVTWSAAETFYERPGNEMEPPNEMNPNWHARLAPFDASFQRMMNKSTTNKLQKGVATALNATLGNVISLMKPAWKGLGGDKNDIDASVMMTH